MTPIWLGRTPDLKKRVTIFSTLEASVLRAKEGQPAIAGDEGQRTHLLRNDVPLDEISS
jgi:hypothetical protein